MGSLLHDLLFDYTLRTVAIGSAALGIVAGVLGAFAVLRRQSLLGDAIAHTALPGIALAYLVVGTRSMVSLMTGAAVAGWTGAALVTAIVRSSRVKYDSALGIVLSVFFGIGLVLLTFIQRMPNANKAGLDTFLFGQASALTGNDVLTLSVTGGVMLLVVGFLFKETAVLCFDPDFGRAAGLRLDRLDIVLTGMLVLAIVLGLQTVGVVLMSALVVAPAAAARQWTNRLGAMVILSGLFGAIAGVGGTLVSSSATQVPTGPAIVLIAGVITIISLLAAPARGVIWSWAQRYRRRKALQLETVLLNLYELSQQHPGTQHAHPVSVLQSMTTQPESVLGSLRELRDRGWATVDENGLWILTEQGVARARYLTGERRVH